MTSSVDLPGLTDLAEVGRGGYGVVYRARQEQLRRSVAVKVLTTRLDDRAAERFAQECRALGTVSGHPHIVPVYEAGTTAAGEPFLVMPFCERGSLQAQLETHGPMPWQDVVDVGVRMAGALQTAHDAGILHRDIKPANILLDSYGVARLADFGQARHTDSNLTRTGEVVATPGFAAPEILSGQLAGPRSDVYSLAATLLALMLGHGPFNTASDENVAAVMYRVISEPPPDLRASGVPDAVCGVLEWAMTKDPTGRPVTARELGEALQRAQAGLGLSVTPLALAGRPSSDDLPVVHGPGDVTVAAEPDAGAAGTDGPGAPRPGTQAMPPRASTPPVGYAGAPPSDQQPPGQPPGSPPGQPPAQPPTQPPGRRRRWPWIAAAAVAVVAVAAATIVVIRMTGAPEPRQISDPTELLLAPKDFRGTWEVDAGTDSMAGQMFGLDQYWPEFPSGLADCVGMDAGTIDDWRVSGVYTTPENSSVVPDSGYAYAQSIGILTDSESKAGKLVDAWRSPNFDGCLEEARSDAVFSIGDEEDDYEDDGRFAEPPLPGGLPETVNTAIRRIEIPLTTDREGFSTDASQFVDVVAMSAGTSVIYLLLRTEGKPPPEPLRNQAIQAMADRLVE